ncbi:C6 and C2H2 transcription factor [Aspergillus costaricaensis CBS 115574]|uniref:C6 and C2H2 transcription factor n=1 Tax=Aspergillus costaricaensis CBS 115574 TaxID=1448317 RepID=A0ACD1ITF6_9EURO|nr:C6 and C2H2 transcription factor [Aspergillus costaricaensis CBS 115574]RAK93700.1 C6 and C2H2 transcription factor [Aspergillus costaricaensis CBS 115574]
MPPPKPTRSHYGFRCGHPGCGATYQRREHLKRHSARHNEGERLSCPYCESTLARRNTSDLLRRHVRNYHPERKPPQSRAVKACQKCHVRKERCDGGHPCSRCQQRGLSCSLDVNATEDEKQQALGTQEELRTELNASVPDASRWIAQDFIDIYFREFHPVWPFLHKGTFDLTKEPCILIQSMLMIGLWIKGDREGRESAMHFHHKLLSAIQTQKSRWHVSESTPQHLEIKPWQMPTYQSILLQLIFALLIAKQEVTFDLNLRCHLPSSKYELLTSLVETCRQLGLFSYPSMLAQHPLDAPVALIWVSVEEAKRFGMALYKLCRLCGPKQIVDSDGQSHGGSQMSALLTLADLDFSMPDSDEVWNASSEERGSTLHYMTLQHSFRDNRDTSGWISQASVHLHDDYVHFDWI